MPPRFADANLICAANLKSHIRERLVNAGFEIFSTGHKESRMVYLQAGNKLRLTRYCDGLAMHCWMTANGFLRPEEPLVNRLTTRHEIGLERN